jgi:hypothetical protein
MAIIHSNGRDKLSTTYLGLGLAPKRTTTAVAADTAATVKSAAPTFLRYVRVHAADCPVSQPA